jgi:hypothetical protein
MIQVRLYNPTKDELIYHYCGADAFTQIVQSRTMDARVGYRISVCSSGAVPV